VNRKRTGKAPPTVAYARETVRGLLAMIKAKEAQMARLLNELNEARALLLDKARSAPGTRENTRQRLRACPRTGAARKATAGGAYATSGCRPVRFG
jgi:hypothetical protein